MNDDILINVTPQETRVAVMEQGIVQELHIERGSHRGMVGNIYFGRVKRVLPGMQSAFIDIGQDRSAFLHVADIWENQHNGDVAKPIEKVLAEGQSLLVQVIKDPIGTKGARLSTQISIAGRLLVFLPQESHIGVSQRIEDEAEREHLREQVQRLLPPGHRGGYIVRTVAETLPGFDVTSFSGVAGPPRMPRAVTDRLNREIRAVLADPETKKHVTALGGDIHPGTPEEMRQRVEGEITKWRRIVAERKIDVR